MTFTMPDPPASIYPWKTGKQIFGYPLITVFAPSWAEAVLIAHPEGLDPYDDGWLFEATMDSIEAQMRLGLFGRPDLFEVVLRGE